MKKLLGIVVLVVGFYRTTSVQTRNFRDKTKF